MHQSAMQILQKCWDNYRHMHINIGQKYINGIRRTIEKKCEYQKVEKEKYTWIKGYDKGGG